HAMKTWTRTLAAPLMLLSAAGVLAFAQDVKPSAPRPAQPAGAAAGVITGKSANGSLQEALDDALLKAQQSLAKTGADAMFGYQVDTISGKRGGIAGVKEVSVSIRILP